MVIDKVQIGEILQSFDHLRLAPMYDGKWSFSSQPPLLLISEEDRGKSIETIIEHFLNTASLSSIKNFFDYYKQFDVNKICMNFTRRREIITKVLNK